MLLRALLFTAVLLGLKSMAFAEPFRIAVTTSFEGSGMSQYLLPSIETELQLDIQSIIAGSGQALKLVANGDVDAAITHAPTLEKAHVKARLASQRTPIMWNQFIIIGPKTDPAKISQSSSLSDAFAKIQETNSPFISRGDFSGTHMKELDIWANLSETKPSGTWYRNSGSGMGTTLNIAVALGAYTLSDSASWNSFSNQGSLAALFNINDAARNEYSLVLGTQQRLSKVKFAQAQQIAKWLTSQNGQKTIKAHQINGTPLFNPVHEIP